ncbi:MAG TPA: Ig-like domain repeat protein, partial [Candidatus Acidoferrales bacterium]|nr:Ig-like domain repeat protein [Candidatus Acidoferrales bacterium]
MALTKVVASGDSAPIAGTTFTFPEINFNFTPSPSVVNDAGQIAFWSSLSNGQEGIFLYTPTAPSPTIAKVAASGDVLASGTIQFLGLDSDNGTWALNSSGQVAFAADTTNAATGASATGVYVGTATGPTAKVAATGDPVAGSTISSIEGVSSFNASGVAAFRAGLSTSPSTYGFFSGTGAGAITTVALDGQAAPTPAPAGSIFSTAFMNVAGQALFNFNGDVQINNEGDALFRSALNLSGGGTSSGYFRSLKGGPPQAIVLQGQAVPGGLGSFGEFPSSAGTNQLFALGPDGTVDFSNLYQNASGTPARAAFNVRTDGTIVKIVAPGDPVPGTGGGTLFDLGFVPSPGPAGEFGFWAGTSGSSVRGALVVSAGSTGTNSTSTALLSSLNPSTPGSSVTFTATVTSPSLGAPTGSVTFLDGGVALGSGTLNATAQATFTTSALGLGAHSITAQYTGDAIFATSVSATLTQNVLAASCTGTISWTNPLGGDFNTATNWNTGLAPTSTDDVCISPAFAGVTVTFTSGTVTIHSLVAFSAFSMSGGSLAMTAGPNQLAIFNQSGGTLNGGLGVAITGLYTWTGGTLTGNTATTSTASGGINLNGVGVDLDTITLVSGNNQITTLTGASSSLFFSNNAVFSNPAGSTFNVQNDNPINGTGTFTNAGTFTKSGGTTGTTISSLFNNTGTVNANVATLTLSGNGV